VIFTSRVRWRGANCSIRTIFMKAPCSAN